VKPAELRADLEQFGAELGMEVYVQHEDIFLATNEPRPVRVGSSRNPEGSDVVVPH
jgi:glycine cleavage system transcriptional repressor